MESAHSIPSDEALSTALASLPGWSHVAAKLEKTFQFEDFVEAFGWMTAVALVACSRAASNT